jgi:hypothetical protein
VSFVGNKDRGSQEIDLSNGAMNPYHLAGPTKQTSTDSKSDKFTSLLIASSQLH